MLFRSANIFFGTGIPTIIMVLKQKRTNTDVLIIDASKGYTKEGKNNKLRASDIKRIVDAVVAREDIPKFCMKVSRDTIRANEYNLNIPRYVDSSDKGETWDIYATIFGGIPHSEIEELAEYWTAFPSLKKQLFSDVNGSYATVATDDVIKAIKENADVQAFVTKYKTAFVGFDEQLNRRLIEQTTEIVIPNEESSISSEIFARLSGIPLVDKYHAYQLLDDEWSKIATDLEIIQTEGFNAVKKTDAKMVLKKKDGKDIEVQDGWMGHVIPFELVQREMLTDKKDEMSQMENRLTEIVSAYDEFFESLTEEEKSENPEILSEEGDALVFAGIAKKAKQYQKTREQYDEESIEVRIIKIAAMLDEEKELKRNIKVKAEKLLALTKQTIENLTDEQAKLMLNHKWIKPLCDALTVIPDSIVSVLESKINALTKKYSVTMLEVEDQIAQSEKAVAAMIDDLEGDEFDMKGLKELQKLLKGE